MLDRLNGYKKLIIGFVVLIIILIMISILLDRCSIRMVENINKSTNINQLESLDRKLSMYNYYESNEVINGLTVKGADWSNFPLSENFLNKYNNNEGIFPEYIDYYDTTWNYGGYDKDNYIVDNKFDVHYRINWFLNPEIDRPKDNYYRVFNIIVTYVINSKGEIDDIIKGEPDLIYENGEYLKKKYDKTFTSENYRQIITDILFFDGKKKYMWNSVAPEHKSIRKEPCSKKLCDKVLNTDKNVNRVYTDFFPQYNCGGGAIYFENGTTSDEAFNNREFFITCRVFRDGAEPYYEWENPEHNYLYKVKFVLDSEEKLDDFTLEYIKEISNEELEEKYHF